MHAKANNNVKKGRRTITRTNDCEKRQQKTIRSDDSFR